MADGITMKVDKQAMAQLERALEELGGKAARRVLRKAATKALKPMVKTARQYLRRNKSKRTGLLAKSLGTKTKTYRKSGTVFSAMGPRSGFEAIITDPSGRQYLANPANYAHLVEFGTRPHGRHPGARAKPFMRPTFDQHVKSVVRVTSREIGKGIEKEAAKLGRKTA